MHRCLFDCGQSINYTFNGDGLRLSRTVGNTTTGYLPGAARSPVPFVSAAADYTDIAFKASKDVPDHRCHGRGALWRSSVWC